jgi:hypothetical protein
MQVYKIEREAAHIRLFGRTAAGGRVEERHRIFETKHIFAPEPRKLRAKCLRRILIRKGCNELREFAKESMFELDKRKLYMSPIDRMSAVGSIEAIECLTVHTPATGCSCELCDSIRGTLRYIALPSHTQLGCNWMNTILHILARRVDRGAHWPKTSYLVTEAYTNGTLKSFDLLVEGRAKHTGNSLDSLKSILLERCEVVVVYGMRPICTRGVLWVDLKEVYARLPSSTKGNASAMKLSIDMHNGESVHGLSRLARHDLGPDSILGPIDTLVALDASRNIVSRLLDEQEKSYFATSVPTSMRNRMFAACLRSGVLLARSPPSSKTACGPKRFRCRGLSPLA